MNKKLILSAAAVAAIGAASFAAFNSNTLTREFSDLELANIEALTQNEAILLDDCYDTGDGTGDWGQFYVCDYNTTENKLYPCSQKEIGSKGTKKKCYKK